MVVEEEEKKKQIQVKNCTCFSESVSVTRLSMHTEIMLHGSCFFLCVGSPSLPQGWSSQHGSERKTLWSRQKVQCTHNLSCHLDSET